jgi:hypothetical protein
MLFPEPNERVADDLASVVDVVRETAPAKCPEIICQWINRAVRCRAESMLSRITSSHGNANNLPGLIDPISLTARST